MRRLNRFPNPQKAITHRLAKGHTLERIADDLQMAYKRVSKLEAEVHNALRNRWISRLVSRPGSNLQTMV